MAKIPFDIKYRPQIESGEYKVETRDGSPARVLCWDANSYTPIVFLVTEHDYLDDKDKEYVYSCNNFGRAFSIDGPRDLFIITPEEELTEFEIRLLDWLSDDTSGEIPMERMKEVVRNRAAELLSLAREQPIKDGYVIEKKTFHDAVKRVDPEVKKEVSEEQKPINQCNTHEPTLDEARKWNEAYEKGYSLGYENGRNEQKRPEVDLEKEVEWEWVHREKQEVDLIECAEMDKEAFVKFAHHFYELGKSSK